MIRNVYIFRHGLTLAVKNHTSYGDTVLTAEILDEGKEAIKRIGQYLKDIHSDLNVSSELLRCRQTVEIVARESNKEFIFDPRLNEPFTEDEEYIDGFERFKQNTRSFINELEQNNYQDIVICTHGAVIAAITHLLVKDDHQEVEEIDYPEPGILWIIRDKSLKEIDFN